MAQCLDRFAELPDGPLGEPKPEPCFEQGGVEGKCLMIMLGRRGELFGVVQAIGFRQPGARVVQRLDSQGSVSSAASICRLTSSMSAMPST
jgi:hypothetical protein